MTHEEIVETVFTFFLFAVIGGFLGLVFYTLTHPKSKKQTPPVEKKRIEFVRGEAEPPKDKTIKAFEEVRIYDREDFLTMDSESEFKKKVEDRAREMATFVRDCGFEPFQVNIIVDTDDFALGTIRITTEVLATQGP